MTQNKTRRHFLGDASAAVLGAAALPATSILPGVFAQAKASNPATKKAKTLVIIYLRGGADALNVIPPYGNPRYYELRPTIAVQPADTDDERGVIKLDDMHGLHPALGALKPYWDKKLFAPILSVGSPHPTRSHFDAQDFMEYAAPGDRSMKHGWLNRYLQESKTQKYNPMRALAMQGLLPRALRGKYPVLAVPRMSSGESEGLLDLFDDVYKTGGGMEEDVMGKKLVGGAAAGRKGAVNVGRHTIETLRHFWEIVEGDDAPRTVGKYPRSGLARRLQMIAKVIKANAGLEVVAIDKGGWDTHQGEGSTDGSINRLLGDVAASMAAFAKDLGKHLDDTMVLVMSEFGRTAAENGNRGTDHGRGGMMLALGGPVNGGRVIGSYGTLERKDLQDRRDLRVDIDFRTVMKEALKGVHDFDPSGKFFPIFSGRDPINLCKA
ncbi:MAG: hypothetical protein CMJ83_14360 [Planctomycetes bacterium]|nr:hypothetical protein [Planctomycetota bacterium]